MKKAALFVILTIAAMVVLSVQQPEKPLTKQEFRQIFEDPQAVAPAWTATQATITPEQTKTSLKEQCGLPQGLIAPMLKNCREKTEKLATVLKDKSEYTNTWHLTQGYQNVFQSQETYQKMSIVSPSGDFDCNYVKQYAAMQDQMPALLQQLQDAATEFDAAGAQSEAAYWRDYRDGIIQVQKELAQKQLLCGE